MVESRWLRLFGPGAVALGAVAVIAATSLGAGLRSWVPPPCVGGANDRVTSMLDTGAAGLAGERGAAWFRLDPVLGADGALAGQRLSLGLDGEPSQRTMELPNETFAAGPFGRLVLVGADDGVRSRLLALDVAGGCGWAIADAPDVVRGATIDGSATLIYEHRVDRATRADLGIWTRPLDGSGAARRILAAPPADDRFGRTFTTTFSWDEGGRRLAVQSCGEVACRTRVLDPDGGPTASVAEPDLGSIIGLDGDRLVTYGACLGLPCPIVSTDLRTGDRRLVVPEGGSAALVSTPDGTTVVDETFDGGSRHLRGHRLDGGAATDLGPVPDGLRLYPGADRADASTRIPTGWLLLAPDGRLPIDLSAPRPQLRHLPDGLTVQLDEAAR
jgi:hypothetical protein